jgi:cob(I)alamin adenosyltransferase
MACHGLQEAGVAAGGVATVKKGAARVYTRGGDAGETALVGAQRVPKDSLRIEAYGTVDELNAILGWCRVELVTHKELAELAAVVEATQHRLFDLGSTLAALPEDAARLQGVSEQDIVALEKDMDQRSAQLEPLRTFVLPGSGRAHAALHLARTVCRRAERLVVRLQREVGCDPLAVRYLNRLSDACFVWARHTARMLSEIEPAWRPRSQDHKL